MQLSKKSIFLSSLFIGSVFFAVSCSQNKLSSNDLDTDKDRKKPVELKKLDIAPAFKNIDVAYQKFGVNPAKAEKITLKKTGTVIEIPADAFVDENGNPVKEKVDISFREFHDAAEIIASGIPMQNPETGEYMETAGMFEIKGHCKGKEIFIAPTKKITVNLASYNEGDRFDFFKLDKNGRWETKQKGGQATINLKRVEELKKADEKETQKPIEPKSLERNNNFVFDFNVNYKAFPELSAFKGIIWQYAGKAKDPGNPELNPEIFETDWQNIEIKKAKDKYVLVLKFGRKKVEIEVLPVLKGTDYKIAKIDFEKNMREYEQIKKEIEMQRKMYDQQAELLRSYSLSGFGIYNWDFWKGDADKNFEVKIDFEPEFDYAENSNTVTYFLVNNRRKAVVRYGTDNKGIISNFAFPSSDKNTLIAILPGNKVAVFEKKDFDQLLDKKNGNLVTIKMKTEKKEITSVDDISKIIAMY